MSDFLHVGKSVLEYKSIKVGFITVFFALAVSGVSSVITQKIQINIFILVLAISFIVMMIPEYIMYLNIQYKIDESALYLRKGFLSIQTITLPYARITNAKFDQTLIQRIFHIGNISLDQEDSSYIWTDIDSETAEKILNEISSRSNIQKLTQPTHI